MGKQKVCIIGLDGVNTKVLDLIIGSSTKGVKTTLISTIPPYTPAAWTSIFTGVNPGMHGVISFLRVNKGLIIQNTSWSIR